VATGDSAWQPYGDQGQWIYTDLGWYWDSYYPWGRIAFHYGRWARLAGYGWSWVPDYTWGPSWVCWRQDEADGFCGWAPLPPGAVFVAGRGLFYHGRLAVNIDFGLRWDAFVFCSYGHLFDRDLRNIELPRERVARIYDRTVIQNHYALVNGRVAVESLGRERMETLTHRLVRPASVSPIPGRRDGPPVGAPRTIAPARRDAVPADRAGARGEGREPDARVAPARSQPSSEQRAPAREETRSAPRTEKDSPPADSSSSSDRKDRRA
jgi:hypothetical protein